MTEPRLTALAHGGGCGCKIAPALLQELLAGAPAMASFPQLLVGSDASDDAAVWQIDEQHCVVATTDFFMPMVDDPRDFGRIAAANALSDIWAMGGRPIMALAICGMPIDKLAPETIRQILQGGASICAEAGIPLAGGHSIDAPEPIFGLAVTGVVDKRHMKRNDTGTLGSRLYLTKPLGIGVLTTAEKKALLRPADVGVARDWMCTLNKPGRQFGRLNGVSAMTDVTGFGLLGHLVEMAEGSGLTAVLRDSAVPRLPGIDAYIAQGCVPGGTQRNFDSYGHKVAPIALAQQQLLCDPQTSGGLLVAVTPEGEAEFLRVAAEAGLRLAPIGELVARGAHAVEVR